MLKFKKALQSAVFAAALAGGISAQAGAIVGATEFTQIANNAELVGVVMNSSKQVVTQMNQYMLQIKQWENQLQNLRGMVVPDGVQDAINQYNAISEARDSYARLYGSLEQQSDMFQRRFDEARSGNLSWADYVKRTQSDAERGVQAAQNRLRYEDRVLKQVQADYERTRELSAKVPQSEGVHSALQLMNSQMNKLLQQNAQMTELIAMGLKNGGKSAAEMGEATQKEAASKLMLEQQKAMYETIEKRQRAFLGKSN